MARGWESKDVESQVEANKTEKSPNEKKQKTQEQLNKDRERQGLELSKKHILADLETAKHPNHRKSLEAALEHLNAKIESLK
ncbi:MAG: hypothetical protein JSS69_03165 [Acidobacteria bacterium]|nr:hypothetical protein [Acidobacteriota bacterium]MBS1864893.1 hypothetical protein [Acidobacteriota bacterium]